MGEWEKTLADARSVEELYLGISEQMIGRGWSTTEFLAACDSHWGGLMEEVMKSEGLAEGEADKVRLKEKLGNLLSSLMIVADRMDIDLLEAAGETMEEILEEKGEPREEDRDLLVARKAPLSENMA